MRTATIEIEGKDYWIAYTAQSQIAMEALERDGVRAKEQTSKWFFALLNEELRAGYRWAKRHGEACEIPPAADDLGDLIAPDQLGEMTPKLLQVMQGERNVISRPPKKAGAGTSDA